MKATFAGANIKGTRAMPNASVRHDLDIVQNASDVFVVQEFKWSSYWKVFATLMGVAWASFPGKTRSLLRPVEGAQAIFWKKKLFKKLKTFSHPAFNFDLDNAGIMDNRWIRAVLLQDRQDRFTSWYLTTHFVVGGDQAFDGPKRKEFMKQNINRLDHVLTKLQNTGYPICGEIDGNIHKGSWAYALFMEMMHTHGATFHGELGVEYAFTINGRFGTFNKVVPTVIPTSRLKTDHEVRVLEFVGTRRGKETA